MSELENGKASGANEKKSSSAAKGGKARVMVWLARMKEAKDKNKAGSDAYWSWRKALTAGDLAEAEKACGSGEHDRRIFCSNLFYHSLVPCNKFGIKDGNSAEIFAMEVLAGLDKMDWLMRFSECGALSFSNDKSLAYIFAKACSRAFQGTKGAMACKLIHFMLANKKADLFEPLSWIPEVGGFVEFDYAIANGCSRAMGELDPLGALAIHANPQMMLDLLELMWNEIDERPLAIAQLMSNAMGSIGRARVILNRLSENGSRDPESEACRAVLDGFLARLLSRGAADSAVAPGKRDGLGNGLSVLAQQAEKEREASADAPASSSVVESQLSQLIEEVALLREGQVLIAQAIADQKRPEKTVGLRGWLGRAMEERKGGRHGSK